MEEKNELPVEVVQEIEAKAKASIRLKGWGESLQFECYVRGATTYATKLHQAEEKIKVMEYDNNRLKGEVEGLRSAVEEYKQECDRLAKIAEQWQRKYNELKGPSFIPPKIDNNPFA